MKLKKIYVIIGCLILLFGSIFVFFILKNKEKEKIIIENENNDKIEEKKLTIVDVNSKTRAYAVMINNHSDARHLQSGLQDAYIVYEMQVEGGITRLMALFKDKDTSRIGSVRSARHTYLDYAMENDAIYVHFGWSYVAEEQIPKLGVNNINGLYDSGFFRDTTLNVAYEHTAFTSIKEIEKATKSKGYRLTTDRKLLLNYSIEEIDSSGIEGNVAAESVQLNFSTNVVNIFTYDSINKVYKRKVNNVEVLDHVTKKPFTAKNIIAVKVKNWTMAGTTLQDFSNVGEGDGYYITNGVSVPIKWTKDSRSSQTVYRYLNGDEIKVNDGNTYIAIVPLGNTIVIK